MSVAQPARLDAGVEVEAHGELVGPIARQALAMGRRERVLAIEAPPVGVEPPGALVHHAEAVRVPVVGAAHHGGVVAILAGHQNLARPR